MLRLVFVTSGYSHLKDPDAQSKSIEMPKGFTISLWIAEVAGELGVAVGVITQVAAFGLIALMPGAMGKKVFSWHTGFLGEKTYRWHYDLMFILMCLIIAFMDGGQYVLLR